MASDDGVERANANALCWMFETTAAPPGCGASWHAVHTLARTTRRDLTRVTEAELEVLKQQALDHPVYGKRQAEHEARVRRAIGDAAYAKYGPKQLDAIRKLSYAEIQRVLASLLAENGRLHRRKLKDDPPHPEAIANDPELLKRARKLYAERARACEAEARRLRAQLRPASTPRPISVGSADHASVEAGAVGRQAARAPRPRRASRHTRAGLRGRDDPDEPAPPLGRLYLDRQSVRASARSGGLGEPLVRRPAEIQSPADIDVLFAGWRTAESKHRVRCGYCRAEHRGGYRSVVRWFATHECKAIAELARRNELFKAYADSLTTGSDERAA